MNLEQIFEFTGNHTLLVLAFFGTLGILIFSEISRQMSGMKSIGPSEATQLSNREDAVFLDIRNEADFQAGHIPDAVHIPLKQLAERSAELAKHKDKPVIAYCRSGNQSNGAGGILKRNGFESVYNLDGGIKAWQKANMPLSSK